MDNVTINQMVHAQINVRDMDKTIPFYEMLGFEVFADQIFEAGDTWNGLGLPDGQRFRAVFMKIPGDNPVPFLDIIEFIDPKTQGSPYPTLHNVGINRICFEIDDIEASVEMLKSRGVEFAGPIARYEIAPGVMPEGVEARFVCAYDPDGTVIEYVEFAGDAMDVLEKGG